MLSIAEWTDRALALSSPMKLTSSASFSPSIRISLRLKIHQAQAKNFCRVLDIRVPQIMDADSLYTSSFRTALHFAGQEVFGEGKDSLVRFRLVERLDVIPHFVADVLRHLNGSIALFRLGRRDDVLTIQAGIRLADGHGSFLKIEVGRGQRQQLALTESAPVQHFKCVVREGLVHNRL